MNGLHERLLGRIVPLNNRMVRWVEGELSSVRALEGATWNGELESKWSVIRREWDRFVEAGGRLPRIEEVLGEDQGNEGCWSAGLLIAHGRPVAPLAARFPFTTTALLAVPGLRSALWSQLDAGAVIPVHTGPNAGVLRYHLGVRCGDASAVEVGGERVSYRDGRGVLFDDTEPHTAWNRGDEPRVTLFCELLRPLPVPARWGNVAVQMVLARDARYRLAPARAAAWDAALNHALT